MKLTKNPVFLHYFSKFMMILLFVLKYMFISLLLKVINGFSWPTKIMASPFKFVNQNGGLPTKMLVYITWSRNFTKPVIYSGPSLSFRIKVFLLHKWGVKLHITFVNTDQCCKIFTGEPEGTKLLEIFLLNHPLPGLMIITKHSLTKSGW